jgi:predicted small metal-binding protein
MMVGVGECEMGPGAHGRLAWGRSRAGGHDVKKNLACPCGEMVRGEDEDDLVAKAEAHLRDKHPDKVDDYTRDMILFMAY